MQKLLNQPRLIECAGQSTHISRQQLLARLRRQGEQHSYRRYGNLPLRYAGGKSLGVGAIMEHLPDNVRRLVSPFFGGGAFEIACARELGIKVQGYDLFDILTNYWEAQIHSPAKLADRLEKWQPTKQVYAEVKERLKGHWTGEQPIPDRLELAAHYWFNHNLSYGPGFLGWMSRIYEQPERYARLVNKVRDFHAPTLEVGKGDFIETLPAHRDEFLYCDPPYYLDGDSKMFRGIYPQRNFPVHHKGFNHWALRELLQQHRGGFILSYNDCETIREWYRDCDIHKVRWQYTLGQGETRIGKNRIENGTLHHVKRSHELLVVGRPRR